MEEKLSAQARLTLVLVPEYDEDNDDHTTVAKVFYEMPNGTTVTDHPLPDRSGGIRFGEIERIVTPLGARWTFEWLAGPRGPYALIGTSCSETLTVPNRRCPVCGFDAGPNNGWFGDDPRCLDCRQDADRDANGWTPENSLT